MKLADSSFSRFCSPYCSQLTSLNKSSLKTEQKLVALASIVVLQLILKIAIEKKLSFGKNAIFALTVMS